MLEGCKKWVQRLTERLVMRRIILSRAWRRTTARRRAWRTSRSATASPSPLARRTKPYGTRPRGVRCGCCVEASRCRAAFGRLSGTLWTVMRSRASATRRPSRAWLLRPVAHTSSLPRRTALFLFGARAAVVVAPTATMMGGMVSASLRMAMHPPVGAFASWMATLIRLSSGRCCAMRSVTGGRLHA